MNTQPDSREWETLSAYLDGALSPTEKQQLETRLQTSPELQQILQELRITRALLRSVPRRRAPRNFTLTPQMAGIRPPQRKTWLVPVFSMSSALATLLLVISLFVEMFAAPGAAAPMQLVAAPSAAQPQAEMDTFAALQPTETPMIITWNFPLMGLGGGNDMPSGAVAEGKGSGEPAPMIMEAPMEEVETNQAPLDESAEPAAEPAAEETAPLIETVPEEAESTLPTEEEALAEAAAPAVEPAPAAQEEAYPEPAEELAIEEEQPLPTEISPLPTSEPARGLPPTETPVAYVDESLPLESQPPQALESPEEPRESSDAGEVVIFGLPSQENAGQIISTSPALAKGVAEASTPADGAAPGQAFPWRMAQVGLLIFAAICGGFAFLLHRKQRS